MPLIILCGIPCSGKSTRAHELRDFFAAPQQNSRSVVIASDDDFLPDKNKGYQDSYNEKETRGKLKSAVERAISQDQIVIADSLNYIKGFRYELYCVARSARTPHCVLYCDTPVESAKKWNTVRMAKNDPKQKSFDEKLLVELSQRMEIPNENRRWDKPLFTVTPDKITPCEEIMKALITAPTKPTVNQATLPQKLSDNTLLYELDKITNEIISFILENKSTCMQGDKMSVPRTNEKFTVPHRISLAELRKIRTYFVKLTQMHPPNKVDEIGKLFVIYLNNQFGALQQDEPL